MLRSLLLPFSIYRLRMKMHAIESRIKKMESRSYLDLQGRKEVAELKRTLMHLHNQEAASHYSFV